MTELAGDIASHGIEHVVFTGGNPMLPVEIVELTQRLRERQPFIAIETAETVFREVEGDLMAISPKQTNSTPSVERSEKSALLEPLTQQTGLRFSSRLHIAAHGNKRST